MVSPNTSNSALTSGISSLGGGQQDGAQDMLLELVAERAPAAWAVLDRDLEYLLVSRQWREDFGLEDHTVLGTSHFDVFVRDPNVEDAFHGALEGIAQEGSEGIFRTHDGRAFPVRWEIHPIGSAGVEALAVFVQKTAPQDESDQLYRILSEYSLDLVCLHDSEGRYQYVSPSVTNVLGYAPEELVGTRPDALIHEEDKEGAQEAPLQSLFGAGSGETIRYRARHKDGSYRWLETNISFVADEEGEIEYILTNSRDVSERVQAKDALRQTNRVLAQRNRELQDFAYVASHDLQEPLRKIRAFANLLKEDYDGQLDEMGEYYLDRMHDAAARMARLIADLLAFSRVTTKTRPFQRVDLRDILNHVISDLEIQISELEGTVEIGSLPVISADPTQMRQLFQNLLSNAIKFHRTDVRPVVSITEASDSDEYAEEARGENTVSIVVKDNGIGFDEKYLSRIFSPFERLHRRGEYPGTGMGLAISRRIVERHHGTIRAQSTPGEGSTFLVTLPREQENNSRRMETSDA